MEKRHSGNDSPANGRRPEKQVLGINSVSKLMGGNTFTLWAGKRIIELAGGIDPSAGLSAQEVSGEWVLQQNPEVIIVSIYWLTEGLGYGAADTDRVAEVHGKVCRHPVIGRTRAGQSGKVFIFSYYGVASGGRTAQDGIGRSELDFLDPCRKR